MTGACYVYELLFVWLIWLDFICQCLGVGDSALTLAAERGHKDLAEMLVAKGADINHVDIDGMPIPVHTDASALCEERLCLEQRNRTYVCLYVCTNRQIRSVLNSETRRVRVMSTA